MSGGGTVWVGQDGDTDAFDTARLRGAVLDAWTSSPARFREDANAEEELVLGGYRDRLLVELAQNAADAATRADTPGRLLLALRDGVLVAANNGAPLDAAGVESLATLRASAKRDSPGVGRFGVGFSAVLAVTDEPAVVSRTGGVRWSLADARELVTERAHVQPGLDEELRRREGHLPLLRLPLPAQGTPPTGYDTAVILPLRDAAARELTRRLLDELDDALLLTLPGLAEVSVEVDGATRLLCRRTEGPDTLVEDRHPAQGTRTTRWRVATAHGRTDPALVADRPQEERRRPEWAVTWAVPVDAEGDPAPPRTRAVVHAPTPTDDELGLPALLIGTFPLESTRRRIAPGPLTDHLLERAAEVYVRLLREWRPLTSGIVDLVPGPLGRGELDAALRRHLLRLLPEVPFLPSAAPVAGEEPAEEDEPSPSGLRPRDAELVEGAGAETLTVLAELFPGLLPAGLERRPELRTLQVSRVPLGEVIDRLAGVERPTGWWRRLYDSLAGIDPDRLTGLPVPLADGRTTIGPRRVLLPHPATEDADRLARLGLKVAHPDAAHPLLERLGATPATPRAVLTTPQVRAAVAASLDLADSAFGGLDDLDAALDGTGPQGAPDAEELAELVLGLVRDAGLQPGDEPWLAALALPDEDGELSPAGELVYPGSAFHQVIRPEELATVDPEWAERWGEKPLTAVGVLATFALVRATDVVLDPDDLEPREGDYPEPDDVGLLDAVDVWCEDTLDGLPEGAVPPVAAEIVAVRDLDLVDDDQWPRALAMLAQPPLRDALVEPVRVRGVAGPTGAPDGPTELVRPYTAWWLRGHPILDGRRPAGLRSAEGDPLLAGLYAPVDTSALRHSGGEGDVRVLAALGVRSSAAALLDEPGGPAELLARLVDPDSTVTAEQLHGLYGLLAELDPEQVTLPEELRAVRADDGTVVVVDAEEAVVADAPDLVPLAGDRPLLPVSPRMAGALAALLEVPRLSETLADRAVPEGEGEPREVPPSVRRLLPGAPTGYREHEQLLLSGTEVDWRLVPGGALHASTLEGVAAGLAWAAGQWARRFEVAALLEDPGRVAELERERWYE
ncbi:molecular chaperone Hsp90 [Streptomyces sp. NPDC005438]|uniref:sacsin N-terminal ATP-binding-like domain-containing protein n=1 Tax=Streptomyces sp. NPDC005438 TaxID=3156880 RepID=UPI0033AC0E81